MARKWFKVGTVYGHCGAGQGIDVCIPIYAANVMQARCRVIKMSGVKKRFKYMWNVEEVTNEFELKAIRKRWIEFKLRMWARERARKTRRFKRRVG